MKKRARITSAALAAAVGISILAQSMVYAAPAQTDAAGTNAAAAESAAAETGATEASAEAATEVSAEAAAAGASETAAETEPTVTEEIVEEQVEAKESAQLGDATEAGKYLLENRQEYIVQPTETYDSTEEFPAYFDLREKGVVTPVKLQNPWGTCWGFAAIAASETSILTDMGKTYEETGIDLSEHHLAWFAGTQLHDGSSQEGEGVVVEEGMNPFQTGGMMFTATSIFSSGIGPVEESLVPYRGKESKTDSILFLNLDYSADDDWSIPDEYQFVQKYELKESSILPDPAIFDPTKESYEYEDKAEVYRGYNQAATDAIKKELMEGRAVSIAFAADTYLPGQSSDNPQYINTTGDKWLHYTYEPAEASHAVTIVGWDDSIKATDFLDHSADEDGDGESHFPEKDGAWIVKNSWGASTEQFPNNMIWGSLDENGNHDGYFYISYYDKSLVCPETFQYDVDDKTGTQMYLIDQYDYMQTDSVSGWMDENALVMANVFTAEEDQIVKRVSTETNVADETVTYEIYLLNDDATTPTDGTLAATVTDNYAYPGYHRSNLSQGVSVAKGQKYSVVVTQEADYEGKHYYDFNTAVRMNENGKEEYNKLIRAKHEGDDEESYFYELAHSYSVGIVNAGESYVYIGKLGTWSDFSDVIPELQKDEKLSWLDFDNFPIKAYSTFADAAVEQARAEETVLPDLGYAEPVDSINSKMLLICLVAVLVVFILLIVGIVLLVKHFMKKSKAKKLARAKAAEEAKMAEAGGQTEAQTADAEDTADTAATDASAAGNDTGADQGENK